MKFSKSDIAVTAAVILLSGFLFFLFWRDINNIRLRNDTDPLGSVEFRKRSATRRAGSDMNWERLQNFSPVFGGDIIRTADFSEAVVHFEDGSSLDLFENSMLKLNFSETEGVLDFIEGQITFTGGSGRSVKAGSRTVTFSEDSRVSFSRDGDDISIAVGNGTATVTGEDGKEDILKESQELRLNAVSGVYTIVTYPVILLAPEPNQRFISLEEKPALLTFSWETTDPGAVNGAVSMEFSRTADFSEPEVIPASGDSSSLVRESGTWYWRLRDEKGNISSVRRFSLTEEKISELILPPEGDEYRYRKVPPSIIFSWTAMENASAYLFEVSAEPEFRKPIIRSRTILTSLTVNALDEGAWYWRVVPILPQRIVGKEPEPEVRRIRIIRKDEMFPLVLSYPVENSLYQLQALKDKGIAFSWQPNPEAVSYEISVAGNSGMNSPEIVIRTEQPWIYFNDTNAPSLRHEGIYYWSVRWTDDEGNLSPASSARKIQGLDGSAAVRLSYPPDRYSIADSLVSNTRFSWKSNVPGKTLFQVASDTEFNEIVYQEDIRTGTILGKDWGLGDWYWRIRTFNADGTVFLETQPRTFSVVPPLPGPDMSEPVPGQLCIFREGDLQDIRWSKVPGADHYSVRMVSSGTGQTVYEQALISSEGISIPFDSFDDGNYTVKIQGFSTEKPSATRLIGLIGEKPFYLRKLTPIELVSPVGNEAFEGLAAIRKGVPLVWKSKEEPDTVVLSVFSDPGMTNPVFTKEDCSREEWVRFLPDGRYFWAVTGSVEEYDISARTKGQFTINPIPPLPAPELITPADKSVYGPEQLRVSREILFSWEPVEGATHYSLAVFRKGNKKEPLMTAGPMTGTSYLLEDLSVLDKGNFIWVVSAEYRTEEGIVEQPGKGAENRFSVELPSLDIPDLTSGDTYYGR